MVWFQFQFPSWGTGQIAVSSLSNLSTIRVIIHKAMAYKLREFYVPLFEEHHPLVEAIHTMKATPAHIYFTPIEFTEPAARGTAPVFAKTTIA